MHSPSPGSAACVALAGTPSADRPHPSPSPRTLLGWTPGQWLAVIAAALGVSAVVTLRNAYGFHLAGRPMPLWVVFAAEVPIWLALAVQLPGIVWLSRRFPPLGPRAVPHALLHLAGGLATCFVCLVAVVLARSVLPGQRVPVPGGPGFWPAIGQTYLNLSLSFLFIYGTVVGLVLAWTYRREEQERRARESRLEAMLALAERDLLRMQIHPHFLFNTLHAVSALMIDDPHEARRMVVRLSELLRTSLGDDGRHEVTLDEELEFLSRYVEIQQIRFRDRLRVEHAIEPGARRMLLPRLLLQPLVENAMQHGIARLEEGGLIRIAARVEEGALLVEIANDGPPAGPSLRRGPGGSGAGLGLRNSAARLAQLYGPDAGVVLAPRPDGGAVERVRVPARDGPGGDGAGPPGPVTNAVSGDGEGRDG